MRNLGFSTMLEKENFFLNLTNFFEESEFQYNIGKTFEPTIVGMES